MRVRLFIDIDGVLLGRDPGLSRTCLAPHAEALLRLALDRFDAFWLSTHGSEGSIEPILRHLGPHCSPHMLDIVRHIRPARFTAIARTIRAGPGSTRMRA